MYRYILFLSHVFKKSAEIIHVLKYRWPSARLCMCDNQLWRLRYVLIAAKDSCRADVCSWNRRKETSARRDIALCSRKEVVFTLIPLKQVPALFAKARLSVRRHCVAHTFVTFSHFYHLTPQFFHISRISYTAIMKRCRNLFEDCLSCLTLGASHLVWDLRSDKVKTVMM